MPPAQDFKRVGDGDAGPNTGGMGAYAPVPWVSPGLVEEVVGQVVRPTLAELARRGAGVAGLLYTGLAVTSAGPRAGGVHARLGDPAPPGVLAGAQHPHAGPQAAAWSR